MQMLRFVEPWHSIDDEYERETLETQLKTELAEHHQLYGVDSRAVGRRYDKDDVLYALADGSWAIVHLTGSEDAVPHPGYPRTQILKDAKDVEAKIAYDAEFD